MMNQTINIKVVSIFPGMFSSLTNFGVIRKAIEGSIVKFEAINLRDYTKDKHKVTDKPGYGGNSGMVMLAEPFLKFYDDYCSKHEKPYVVMTSPQGRRFDNNISKTLASKKNLVFLCGRYEGPDERVMSIVDDEISIGDFVVTGGELPAMIMIDSLLRFIPGVVGDENSVINDSFYNGLLDYPHYTKPAELRNLKVPEVLLSGNHAKIEKYRKKESFLRTILKRPDLFLKRELKKEDKKIIVEIIKELYDSAQ